MSQSTEEQDRTGSFGRPASLPKRWSARRKAEVVLRLLRGEDIDEVSREIRVAPPELERWRREFLEGGQQGLKGKNRPGGELMRTRAKLGEMTMRVLRPTTPVDPTWPRHGRKDSLRGVQGRDPPMANPQTLSQ